MNKPKGSSTRTKDKTELWFNNPQHAYAVSHTTQARPNAGRKGVTDHHLGSEQEEEANGAPKTQQAWFTTHGAREKAASKVSGSNTTKQRRPTVEKNEVKTDHVEKPASTDEAGRTISETRIADGVSQLFEKLLDRFGGQPGDSHDTPDSALLDIMGVILRLLQGGQSVKEVLETLSHSFLAYGAMTLFREFLQLLLSYGVDKQFLIDNGIKEQSLSPHKEGDDTLEDEDLEDDEEWSGEGSPSAKKSKNGSTKRKSRSGKMKGESKASKKRRLRKSPDKWSAEEDDKLIELVNKYGVNTKKWRAIAEELGTSKNSAKCAQHWRRVLAPNIHKGSWTEDEEEKLLEGVKLYGLTQWTNIAREIPGRTDIQCRYHYLRQSNSREQIWTDEEDELLNKLAAGYPNKVNWVELSDTLANSKLRRTPRTALECKQRWTLINSKGREKEAQ